MKTIDENAVEFLGDEWTQEEKQEIYDLIESKEGHAFGAGYNFWRIRKFDDKSVVGRRIGWDLGGIECDSYDEFITKLKEYLG